MSSNLDFINARFDLLRIFFSAFLIHRIGITLVYIYVYLAFATNLVLQTLAITLPDVLIGILISFLRKCCDRIECHVCGYSRRHPFI